MDTFFEEYDVIVVGAGHAGCEAAHAAATMGSKVLVLTMNMQTIAQMSCNPAMGGIAKGQIIREIDALGGMSGIVTDRTSIQFRMLNRSKGPAMWSPRAQSDRWRFAEEWRLVLERNPNVHFVQVSGTGILVKNDKVVGVQTGFGENFYAKSVVLTSGTFLNGLIHLGEKQFGGGRMGEKSATGITESLLKFGFESGRMKTGTPPRVDGRSLDYSAFERQDGDEDAGSFSYLPQKGMPRQLPCWVAYTSDEVHETLKKGFDRSPMFNGAIQSVGPRYCPSIEDKINRFADKDRHQLFVEPEGLETVEVYVNGFSTSLPMEVQYEALRKIKGFENARFFRPGYAIEYDYFPPTQLSHTLETKLVEGLYFAGQINGTTGYEEAACQGLMAGINAHRKVHGLPPVILTRDQAYIGVLIDDLITKGTEEPYRMFTSRAEFRLLLRQDNADLRLTDLGYEIGLASEERKIIKDKKSRDVESAQKALDAVSVHPKDVESLFVSRGTPPLKQQVKLPTLVSRPQLELQDFAIIDEIASIIDNVDDDVIEQLNIHYKYSGYLDKEKEQADKMKRLEELRIPDGFNYMELQSISMEAREKLQKIKPVTLRQASSISGISPSDIQVLLVHFGR
ncbi:MAG: tRNA uridine-5-carboxymethylaminomethyl(34) synthesis enzyme MnmG [Flavobacteriales bacterium]|nr:MAG: tRNA uridine-5-carboxymethylaminomethyl(34) synthesis enzyme MnmG [Flavobacteriales bacterium]